MQDSLQMWKLIGQFLLLQFLISKTGFLQYLNSRGFRKVCWYPKHTKYRQLYRILGYSQKHGVKYYLGIFGDFKKPIMGVNKNTV